MSESRDRGLQSVIRRWHSVLLPLLVFLFFLAVYRVTLLPDVLPADSGEFQLVAESAGVAHPPGYPLYTMVGWLFVQIPIGPTPAWRMNLLSAITAALAVALVFATARKLSGSILGGLAAALTLGSATTFWATAVKASIRPLTAFFTALCLYALIQHASLMKSWAPDDDRGPTRPSSDRYLVLLAVALSLGLTHHPSLAFPAIAFAFYLVLVDPVLLRQPERWLRPAVTFVLGWVVLLYIPLRGAPTLRTLSGFLDHVLARGFRGDMFALNLFDRLVLLPTLLRFQFNPVILLGAFLGAVLLLWQDRRLALLLAGSFLIHTGVTLTYDAPQTVEYGMPAYVSLALLVAVPFRELWNLGWKLGDWGPIRRRLDRVILLASRLSCLALLAAGLVNALTHLPSYRALSRSRDTRDYVEGVLEGAPETAVILSNWHWFTPLRYLQEVEEARPDIEVEYVAPGGEPLAQTWVRRIETHVNRRPVVVVRYFESSYDDLPYRFEPLAEAFLVRSTLETEAATDLSPLEVKLGEQIELRGYGLSANETEPAGPLTVTLEWCPMSAPSEDIALFAQLIGPDGRLWSAAEDPRRAPGELTVGEELVDRFVVYPYLHAAPGDYRLVVGAYSSEGRFTTPDGRDTVPLASVHIRLPTVPPVTEHPRFVRFEAGPTLIGIDYDIAPGGQARIYTHWAGPGQAVSYQLTGRGDAVLTTGEVSTLGRGEYTTVAVDRPGIPDRLAVLDDNGFRRWNLLFRGPIWLPRPDDGERYVPMGDAMVLTGFQGPAAALNSGDEVALWLRFRGQRPLERDYIVSAAVTGVDADGTWSWRVSHDTVPALGAIPTLKWIRGSLIRDPHRMAIPADVSDVPAVGSFLIYDHFTQSLIPALDERLEPVTRLRSWEVIPQ